MGKLLTRRCCGQPFLRLRFGKLWFLLTRWGAVLYVVRKLFEKVLDTMDEDASVRVVKGGKKCGLRGLNVGFIGMIGSRCLVMDQCRR